MKKYFFWGVVFIVCLAFGFYMYGGGHTKKSPSVVKIGYRTSNTDLAVFVAKEKGFYGEEGLDVEFIKFDSANLLTDALLAEKVDFAGSVSSPVIFSVEDKQPGTFKVLSVSASSPKHSNFWLMRRRGADIQSFDDLLDKRLGMSSGSATEVILKHIVKQLGIDIHLIAIQKLAEQQQGNALEAGGIDGLLAVEPTATAIEVRGIGERVVNIESFFPNPRYSSFAVVTRSFFSDHRDTVDRIRRAQDRAVEYMRQHPEEMAEILSHNTPYTADIISKIDSGNSLKSDEVIDMEKLQEYADIFFDGGEYDNRIDVKKLFE